MNPSTNFPSFPCPARIKFHFGEEGRTTRGENVGDTFFEDEIQDFSNMYSEQLCCVLRICLRLSPQKRKPWISALRRRRRKEAGEDRGRKRASQNTENRSGKETEADDFVGHFLLLLRLQRKISSSYSSALLTSSFLPLLHPYPPIPTKIRRPFLYTCTH